MKKKLFKFIIKGIIIISFLFFIFLPLLFPIKKYNRIERIWEISQWNAGKIQIIIYSKAKEEKLFNITNLAYNKILELDKIVNEFNPKSEAGILKRELESGKRYIKVSKELFYLLSFGKEVYKNTDKVFDITVNPLISLWKKYSKLDKLPSLKEIKTLLKERIGFSHLKLDKKNLLLYCDTPGISISLGGYSKGYIIDKVVEFFIKNKITTGLVNMGGDIRVFGPKEWKIGIQDPRVDKFGPEKIVGIIKLKNKAIATSGHYRRYYLIQGEKYSHIINPKTGYPVKQNIISVSVISEKAIKSDAYATAFCILPVNKTLEIAKKNNLDVLLIIHSNKGYKIITTPNFDKYWEKKIYLSEKL